MKDVKDLVCKCYECFNASRITTQITIVDTQTTPMTTPFAHACMDLVGIIARHTQKKRIRSLQWPQIMWVVISSNLKKLPLQFCLYYTWQT
jgi:hypothetical protein